MIFLRFRRKALAKQAPALLKMAAMFLAFKPGQKIHQYKQEALIGQYNLLKENGKAVLLPEIVIGLL